MVKKFNYLHVPETWQQYWTRYPQGYTIMEALINWVSQVNEMTGNINDWNNYLDDFIKRFDVDLQNNVLTTLKEWQESGFLDVVINEALETKIDGLAITVGGRLIGETTDFPRIKRALDIASNFGGGNVYLPKGEYLLGSSETLTLPPNVKLVGSGMYTTILKSEGERSTRPFEIVGSNVVVEGIGFNLGQIDRETTTLPQNTTMLYVSKTAENIVINQCFFSGGYAGVWLSPSNNQTIKKVTIQNSHFEKVNYGVLIGQPVLDVDRNEFIEDVIITNNIIKDGYFGGDGVKTAQNCENIVITNNVIENMQRDGIDLFTSGDNVIVSNNVIKSNWLNGIDIKQNTTKYPPSINGYNRKMLIQNNIIDDNRDRGVSINQIQESQDDNYLIIVDGNTITGNQLEGVSVSANYTNITNNIIQNNGKRVSSVAYAGIDVRAYFGRGIKGLNISDNIVMNNGNVVQGGYGIYVYTANESNSVSDSVISNNIIVNDSSLSEGTNLQTLGLLIHMYCKNISVYGNKIRGHMRDVHIRNGAGVVGEKITISLSDVLEYHKEFYFLAKSNLSIFNATVIVGEDIPSDSEDYVRFMVVKKVDGQTSPIANPVRSDTTSMVAWTPILIENFYSDPNIDIDSKRVNKGELFGVHIGGFGNAPSLKNVTIEINYIEY